MTDLLGHKSWNRSRKCKRINCCTRPRWTRGAVRLREERQWDRDYFEEAAPETPEWVERGIAYARRRIGT